MADLLLNLTQKGISGGQQAIDWDSEEDTIRMDGLFGDEARVFQAVSGLEQSHFKWPNHKPFLFKVQLVVLQFWWQLHHLSPGVSLPESLESPQFLTYGEPVFQVFIQKHSSINRFLTKSNYIVFLIMEGANWSDKVQMGEVTLNNRIVMAALTRERCDPQLCIPTDLVAEYYGQRTGPGFMLSEATAWSLQGRGFVGAACLYNQDQMDGWKKVIDAVHAKGGKLFIQLFHCGRVSHSDKMEGLQPVAPSAIATR